MNLFCVTFFNFTIIAGVGCRSGVGNLCGVSIFSAEKLKHSESIWRAGESLEKAMSGCNVTVSRRVQRSCIKSCETEYVNMCLVSGCVYEFPC